MRTDRNYWKPLVYSYTAGMTEEQIEAVVTRCVEHEIAKDGRGGVWHSMAEVLGQLDRCHCAPCSRERKQAA